MTKKTLLVLFIILLVLSLSVSCNKKQLTDGMFKETEEAFDDHGWKAELEITIKEGKITEAFYDEINKEGVSKRTNEEYAEKLKKASNTTPQEAFSDLEANLIKKQNTKNIDSISGATKSSGRFTKLAQKIIQ